MQAGLFWLNNADPDLAVFHMGLIFCADKIMPLLIRVEESIDAWKAAALHSRVQCDLISMQCDSM